MAALLPHPTTPQNVTSPRQRGRGPGSSRALLAKSRARRAGAATIHSRISDHWRAAQDMGATETEAAWIAMACEIEIGRRGRTWTGHAAEYRAFIAAELAYLRDHADLRVEKWRAPEADEWPAIDAGWMEETA